MRYILLPVPMNRRAPSPHPSPPVGERVSEGRVRGKSWFSGSMREALLGRIPTPALSQGKRENRAPVVGVALHEVCGAARLFNCQFLDLPQRSPTHPALFFLP